MTGTGQEADALPEVDEVDPAEDEVEVVDEPPSADPDEPDELASVDFEEAGTLALLPDRESVR